VSTFNPSSENVGRSIVRGPCVVKTYREGVSVYNFYGDTETGLFATHVLFLSARALRHGLRSTEWRGRWCREGALRAPSLHFGWVLRQLCMETDAPLAKPLSLYFGVMRVVALRLSSALEGAATPCVVIWPKLITGYARYATFVHVMLYFDFTSFPSDTTQIWSLANRRTPPHDRFLLHRAPSR